MEPIKTMNEVLANINPDWANQTDWEISPDGTLRNAGNGYTIDSGRLNEPDWILHMMEKRWVNLNTFVPAYYEACYRAGLRVFPMSVSY